MSSSSLSLPQCVRLAFLSFVLASYVTARSLQPLVGHTSAKRFYIPVVLSSDAILESLKDGHNVVDSPYLARENGLERKRTAAARLEYLDSLLPRPAELKRKMFWSPLGYMSASARRLNQNNPGNRPPSNKEDAGSPGFRYG